MLIEAARRAEAAAREMLALVNTGTVASGDLREAMEVSKAFMAAGSAFQVAAAASIANSERHGDGGAEMLAAAAGLSRRDAESQVKTAEALREVPSVLEGLEDGRVSLPNATRLAEAAEKTGVEAVAADSDLLAKAESMRPEQFVRETRRWVRDRDGDSGESEHRRLRARRCVRVWDSDDGMVRLYGEFDPITGQRIRNRLRAEAGRMHDADKKHTASGDERRTFQQCMADALDNLTSNVGANSKGGKPFADICVVAHVDDVTGNLIAELPDGVRLPQSVLEQLACNAKFTGVVYDTKGRPIWRAQSVRCATEAQRQLLIARDGGCFACQAHPDLCQAHHVRPVSQGGATSIDNMVLACWNCHTKIHHFHWQIHGPPGQRTLHPPGDTMHFGPAHAPDSPSMFDPSAGRDPGRAARSTKSTSARAGGQAGSKPPSRGLTGQPEAHNPRPPGQPEHNPAHNPHTTRDHQANPRHTTRDHQANPRHTTRGHQAKHNPRPPEARARGSTPRAAPPETDADGPASASPTITNGRLFVPA